MEGAAEADRRRLEQARHVGTRGTTALLVAKPASHTWASKEQAARKSMLPRSWCVDYTPRGAWSLVGKYSECMEEDAPVISGIKDRHYADGTL